MSLYPPLQRSWKGSILVSPCPSVHLWTESCLLCIFNNTHRIHCTSYQATSEGVLPVMVVSKFKNFGEFFKFVTLTLSSFDLGSNMTQWYGQSWGGGGYPQNEGVLVVLVNWLYPIMNKVYLIMYPCVFSCLWPTGHTIFSFQIFFYLNLVL